MADVTGQGAEVDVVVVGAGLSGLTAARRLQQQGLAVCVLEASDRVGGRTKDLDVGRGVVTEGGGQWIGALHERVATLLDELGLATFPTHTDGETIYLRHGARRTFTGTIPPMGLLAKLDFAQAQQRLERMARQVPVAAPWTAARAVAWDGVTLGHWLDSRCHTDEARHMFTLGFTLMFCEDPHRISLLKVLHSIATSGGVEFMLNTADGAQETRIVGGSQRLSLVLAEQLGDRVLRNSPVTAVDQSADEVHVRSARLDVRCRHVIVAMTPADVDRIAFVPDLPTRRSALQRVWHNGTESKLFAVYDRPFWREQGLNGSALTDLPLAHYVIDNSPPDGSLGVLLTFVGTTSDGPGLTSSTEVLDDPAAREKAFVADLTTLFGPDAEHPRQILEQSWVHEPWITGCVSTRAPGVMIGYTDAVTRPVDRVHWAGTEAAPAFEGYLEGAVRAAERAVEEIVAS